jgi:preprotein translocase subunit SecG
MFPGVKLLEKNPLQRSKPVSILLGIFNALIVLLCLCLIAIILIQRGKGGGLAGAFGGVGGSSAFGTKAGDVFTRTTVGIAIAWIALSMLMVILTNRHNESAWGNDAPSSLARSSESGSKRSKAGAKPGGTAADEAAPAPSSTDGTKPSEAPPVNIPARPEMPESPASNPPKR